MTLVNAETGELIEPLDAGDAERLSTRIRLRLDTIADNYVAVMPLIREAITREAHKALGYRSPGEYISDRFGDALSKLGVEVRREVVRELTDAGMSTRAIAPVVGVNNATVHRDLKAGVASATPEPSITIEPDELDGGFVASVDDMPGAMGQGETPEDAKADALEAAEEVALVRPAVTGIDGKTYTRPEPKPRAIPRRALTNQFFDAIFDLTKVTERIDRLANDDRFPQNAEKVAAKHRSDLLRAIDGLQSVANRLPSA